MVLSATSPRTKIAFAVCEVYSVDFTKVNPLTPGGGGGGVRGVKGGGQGGPAEVRARTKFMWSTRA